MNLFRALVFLSLLTSVGLRAESDYTLEVKADRPDAIYRSGETVTFAVSLSQKGAPVNGGDLKWNLSKDGKAPPLEQGIVKLENGKAKLTGTLSEPGFLRCTVEFTPPGKAALTAVAGAAIDPFKIQPSQSAPEDFDAYWSAEKQKLAAIPLNIQLTPVKWMVPGVECFDVQADNVGAPLSGYLVRPIEAKPKSLPAIVLFHGAGVRSSRLGTAAAWAKDGFLALDFNVHGLPNGQPREFYDNLEKGDLKQYVWQGRESRETNYFHNVFLRIIRAIDVLAAQPEWDGKILIADGRSQGGGQAIVAGALDSRVTYVSAQIPALCDHTGILVDRVNGWPRFVSDNEKNPDDSILQASRYYDAVNFAKRIKVPAFFTVGFVDHVCPPTGVYAAYNQIGGKKQILNHVSTGHVNTPEEEEIVRQDILNYVKEGKK